MGHNKFWSELKTLIKYEKIIPVIGPDLVFYNDAPNENIYEHLVREIIPFLDKKPKEENNYREAISLNLDQKSLLSEIIISSIAKDRKKINTVYLEKIARITKFKCFINCSIDGLLAKTIAKERNISIDEIKIVNISKGKFQTNKKKLPDLNNKDEIVIFNLLGNIEPHKDFACCEEEVLEHLITINRNPDKRKEIDILVSKLKGNTLMFIGCDFPDWLFRLVIRVLSEEGFQESKQKKYIVDNRINKLENLSLFLNRFEKVIVIDNQQAKDYKEFVEKLHNTWWDEIGKDEKITNYINEHPVFLCFNSRDRLVISEIVKSLEQKNIRNFFYDDDALEAGAYYEREILDSISECDLFIPFISKHTLDKKGQKAYSVTIEWDHAIARKKVKERNLPAGKKSFVMPFIIDNTNPRDKRIPKQFGDLTIKPYKDNKDIVNRILKRLNH